MIKRTAHAIGTLRIKRHEKRIPRETTSLYERLKLNSRCKKKEMKERTNERKEKDGERSIHLLICPFTIFKDQSQTIKQTDTHPHT